jgi:hypothetical protein
MIAALTAIIAPTAALAADPTNVSSDLVICKGDTASSNYLANPDAGATQPKTAFICTNTKQGNGYLDYSGNAGKGWNELDLVPFRLTLDAGSNAPAVQTYTKAVALDAIDGGKPGFDVLTIPTLNSTLSANSCSLNSVGPESLKTPGFGGTDVTRYRKVTMTQSRNTTCVLDFDGRLAVGSHLYPGASLHGNEANEALTQTGQDRSIPVNEIQPQAINKDMSAQRDVTHTWNLTKSATPASLDLGDQCAEGASAQADVDITVTWTKGPATPSGETSITANIYATNPAHRTITVDVTDRVYEGATQTTLIHTGSSGAVDVPANTTMLVFTDPFTTSSTATSFNDVATATYTDKDTGVPVPGTTTATASATVTQGDELNATNTITDTESITGSGLTFSVAAPSVGSFVDAGNGLYVAGTHTTGPVDWSYQASDSGSVTFEKTVYFAGTGDADGTLSDTASSDLTEDATVDVDITSSSIATLTINKTTDVDVAANTVFQFTVTGPGGFSAPVSVTVPAGTHSGSNTLGGLGDGNYLVTESDSPDYNEDTPKPFTIDAGECADSVTFNNTLRRANIIVQKVTVPAGSDQAFTFDTSYKADFDLKDGESNDSGPLLPGNGYSVAENTPAGWDLTSATCSDGSDPSNISLSAGETVTCTFTNTQRGKIIVKKLTDPAGSSQVFGFTSNYGPSFNLTDGQQNDSGPLVPGKYNVAETPVSGWDLTSTTCDQGETIDDIDLGAGETVTCTFTNTRQTGNIIVDKVTDPAGSSQSFDFVTSYAPGGFALTDTDTPNDSGPLPTGVYSVSETAVPGWDITKVECSDGSPASAIDLGAHETVTCTFTNTQRGNIIVKKVTDPSGSAQVFGFTSNYGPAFGLTDGQQNDSGLLVPGKYNVAETPVSGWDLTSATCDHGETINDIDVGAGETVTCTFTNTQRGTISVSKTLTNGPSDTTFTFELRELSNDNDPLNPNDDTIGALLDSKVIAANNTPVQLNGFLKPGTYTICEVLPGPGWTSDLGGASQYTLTINLDNSRVCADFTLAAGEAKVVAVANTRPGGAQLTIGFWKNHASCKKSNGGQAAVLDATLALAGTTLVGNLSLTGSTADCVKAVNVLNKTTIDGKTKKASDPLFNMAAQLLAARLNVTGGAGTCTQSTNAINAAQALLVKYGWNGLTYGPPGFPALTPADAALANQLNNTLDLYNNGNLC